MAVYDRYEADESPEGLIQHLINVVKDTLLAPIRILTSKVAVRAYITSLLYLWTALLLFFVAISAYVLFYWTYIPRIGFERTIHLQFDPIAPECYTDNSLSVALAARCAESSHPWGVVQLAPDIVSQQRYDVQVVLTLPRTPDNTGSGNFMLDARMYAPDDKGSAPTLDTIKSGLMLGSSSDDARVLARSRRPAIMTYFSKEVDLMNKASQLHWYFLGLRKEAETLVVDMFEGVEFVKGWRNVPHTMRIEVQTQKMKTMQFYDAKVVFRARFAGLRWLMYNHRFISAAVFIMSFWVTEMVFASAAWLVMTWIIFGGDAEEMNGKIEDDADHNVKEENMSDTERSFPTYGSQPPLRYQSQVKKEEPDMADLLSTPPALIAALDADVEDEDDDFVLDEGKWQDSGLGTSMESSGPSRSDSIRMRRSRPTASDL